MNLQLIRASGEHKTVIKNLMQLYIYDFSEYVNGDVKEGGLFAAYPHFEKYWKEKEPVADIQLSPVL
jgi:hypothetical protein